MLTSDLSLVYPEIWVLTAACFTLIADLFLSDKKKWLTYAFSQASLIGALFFLIDLLDEKTTTIFNKLFILDPLGSLLKLSICLVGAIVFLYSRKYISERKNYNSEYYILCLFSILGMMVLVSANHFLSLYLGIELFALPLYALITIFKDDELAAEAAMKYFIMGALASGMLLYGISLIYGVTGSLEMNEVAKHLSIHVQNPPPAILFAIIFLLVGLGFKLGVVPFHMWLPDVYQGSPISVTLFIGTLPKLAAFAFAIRLLVNTFPDFYMEWQQIISIMALLSLFIGNVVAVVQRNLKRLLAYSTIAHMGFLLLGIMSGPKAGYAAALQYAFIYTIMSLGILGIMTVLSNQNYELENIQDLKGLARTKPCIAFLLMMILLSFTGIPPFAGFYAKLFVLDALINAGNIWLSVATVFLTVVGAYYYLRIIRVMYFEEPTDHVPFSIISKPGTAILSINTFSLLLLGLFPTYLLSLCQEIFVLPK